MKNLFMVVLALGFSAALVWKFSRKNRLTLESFLVGDRKIPLKWGVPTVTANWTQAPALLASGIYAFQGHWQFVAFIIPNVAALILSGVLAPRIQDTMPRGYTLPQLMGKVYGEKVRTLFFILALTALTGAIGYTLTGLRQWFNVQLSISPVEMALVLGTYAIVCVLPRGVWGAVVSDTIKMAVIGLLIVGVVLLHVSFTGATPAQILPAVSSTTLSPEMIFWTVGMPLAASLIGGPICNPDLAERAYALDRLIVRKAYFWSAGIFGLVVLVFGSLGSLARHAGMVIVSPGVPAFRVLEAVSKAVSSPELIIVASIALVVILGAALASFLASAGDLVGIEVYKRVIRPTSSDTETIWFSRLFMLIPILVATYIASLPNIDVTVILQSMAVVRGEAIIPVILAVFVGQAVSARAILWGMLVGAVGGTLLTFGAPMVESIFGEKVQLLATHGKPFGALFAVLAPLVAVILAEAMRRLTKNGFASQKI